MPKLLNRAPFPDGPSELLVRGTPIRVRANQIIAWLSLTVERVREPNPLAVPFPAILDTGHTHTLSLHEQHLREWAGFRLDGLAFIGTMRERGLRVQLYAANVWVHPNRPGTRELAPDAALAFVAARRGIAVYPGGEFPRLPILGLRAVADNELQLAVDGRRRAATVRTSATWWPLWPF